MAARKEQRVHFSGRIRFSSFDTIIQSSLLPWKKKEIYIAREATSAVAIKMPASFIFYPFGRRRVARGISMKIRCASRRGVMYTKSGSRRDLLPVDNCFQGSKKKRLRIPDTFTLSGSLAPDRDLMKPAAIFLSDFATKWKCSSPPPPFIKKGIKRILIGILAHCISTRKEWKNRRNPRI